VSELEYPHLVTILRASDSGVLDAYERPLLTDWTPIEVDVPAWVQQLGVREQQLLSQAGAEHVSHRIFMDPTDVTTADMLRWAVLPPPTTIVVASAGGISDGIVLRGPATPPSWLRIGSPGETEVRQVAAGGVVGLVVTLTAPLTLNHYSGDQVREVVDAGGAETVGGTDTTLTADTVVEVTYRYGGQCDFELIEVKDPDGTGHHLEIIANEIVPVPLFALVS